MDRMQNSKAGFYIFIPSWPLICHIIPVIHISNQKRLTNKEEEDGGPFKKKDGGGSDKWSYIEYDVFELILKQLYLTDYLRIRAVCSNWKAYVTKAVSNKYCIPLPELPLLLSQTQHHTNRFSFFNISTNHFFNSSIWNNNQVCHGTVEGWMIMSASSYLIHTCLHTIFFLNPVTNARFFLPSRLNHTFVPIFKIVASSKPSNPHCIVVCLFSDFLTFAFSRISDKSWTIVEGDKKTGVIFNEVEILDEKLYVITDGKLNSTLVYDLQEKIIKPKILAKLPDKPASRFFSSNQNCRIYDEIFECLAIDASSGDLLLCYLCYDKAYKCQRGNLLLAMKHTVPPRITTCQLFKLDMSRKPKWVEMKKLENRLLFISQLKSLAISTTALDGYGKLRGGNFIYFTLPYKDQERGSQIQVGRLRFSHENIKYYKFKQSSYLHLHTATWFTPSF